MTSVSPNAKLTLFSDTSVEDYVESLESKNTKEKTKQDVKLLEEFLRNGKNDEYLTAFIRSVRRKGGEVYEP